MYYYKARMYSPSLGRFMQTDPIGYEDNVDLYGYVGNDPINKSDPTGLYECEGRQACDIAKEAADDLDAAIKKVGTKGGSKAKAASRRGQLRKLRKALGDEGDNNGLTIKVDTSIDSAANYQANADGSGTININTDRNMSAWSMSAVLGHELSHRAWHTDGFSLRGRGRVLSEITAYSHQILVQTLVDPRALRTLGITSSRKVQQYIKAGAFVSSCKLKACEKYTSNIIDDFYQKGQK